MRPITCNPLLNNDTFNTNPKWCTLRSKLVFLIRTFGDSLVGPGVWEFDRRRVAISQFHGCPAVNIHSTSLKMAVEDGRDHYKDI